MTIREALFAAVSQTVEEMLDFLYDLLVDRHTGFGGQLWAEFRKIFLSRREETTDYAFNDPVIRMGEAEWGAFGFGDIEDNPTILDIMKSQIVIHQRRGAYLGERGDIQRITNSPDVELDFHPQVECGWMLGVTSPGYNTEGVIYNPGLTLTYIGLDNMLDITLDNQSNRSNTEIMRIIRREMIALRKNIRFFFV